MRRLKRQFAVPQPYVRSPFANKRRYHNRSQRYSQGNMHRLISPVHRPATTMDRPLVSPIARLYAAVLRLL